MQYAPRTIAETSLAEPDARKPLPAGVVFVRVTVTNFGQSGLRIRSAESTLELADGRRLVYGMKPPPEETPARPEPTREELPPSDAHDVPAEEPTKKVGEVVEVGGAVIAYGALLFCTIFFPCILGVAAIVIGTSPIWVPVVLVLKHKESAKRQRARDSRLESGDVVLANGESASAVVQFVNDGVDPAGPGSAFLILRATDVGTERDWIARIPVAIPK